MWLSVRDGFYPNQEAGCGHGSLQLQQGLQTAVTLPRQEGSIDLHGSTAVELISAPCDPSVFLAGFKNRILHPHVHWKERSERAVHR